MGLRTCKILLLFLASPLEISNICANKQNPITITITRTIDDCHDDVNTVVTIYRLDLI